MASHNPSITSPTGPKHTLTMKESLQDASITYWGKPIDEALDLHLHGRLVFADTTCTTLARDSWKKWPQQYCRFMLKLVPLISAAQANELLTAKMATTGAEHRDRGVETWVVRRVVADVNKHLEQIAGLSLGNTGKVQGRVAPMQSHGQRDGKEKLGGGIKKTHGGKHTHANAGKARK